VVNIEYWDEEGVHYTSITFPEPIRICFTLTAEQWKEFLQRPDDFNVQFFDSEKFPSQWITLSMVMDPNRYELCGQTDHLSLYALAIRSEESIPVTGVILRPTDMPTPTFHYPQENYHDSEKDGKPVIITNPPLTKLPTNLPPTKPPTPLPTEPPTEEPTEEPTIEPTEEPTIEPTEESTEEPTGETPPPELPNEGIYSGFTILFDFITALSGSVFGLSREVCYQITN
jgi:hypothetical protein